jgi:hypothetical protein
MFNENIGDSGIFLSKTPFAFCGETRLFMAVDSRKIKNGFYKIILEKTLFLQKNKIYGYYTICSRNKRYTTHRGN